MLRTCDHFWSLTSLPHDKSTDETFVLFPSPQEWWYSASEFMGDQWLQTVLSLPSWDKIASGNVALQDVQKNKFLMRVNILDNPF